MIFRAPEIYGKNVGKYSSPMGIIFKKWRDDVFCLVGFSELKFSMKVF